MSPTLGMPVLYSPRSKRPKDPACFGFVVHVGPVKGIGGHHPKDPKGELCTVQAFSRSGGQGGAGIHDNVPFDAEGRPGTWRPLQ